MNYYEHFLGDYNKKTTKLRLVDHGAYRVLLDTYYAEEKPLPGPYPELYTICRAIDKNDQQAVRKVAELFFPLGPDGMRHNERADAEIARAQKRIQASRENGGKRGNRNPTGNPPGNPTGDPAANPAGYPPGTRQGTQQPTQPGEAFPHAPDPIPSGGKEKEGVRAEIPLPKNLSPTTWANWRAHLANLGKGMTPQSERLQLVRLEGHADPEAVVRKAIELGYKNLPPIGGWPDQKTAAQSRGEVAGEIWKGATDERPDERIIDGESERVA
ncbi:MAG: DUF1376 domain-containing protein [Casimicrobiaceae bacterium]